MLLFALLLAFVWGVAVAVFIEYTELGRWIAEHLTWLSVVIGIGGDLLILLVLLDEAGRVAWWQMVAVIGLSSLGVICRGLVVSYRYFKRLMQHAQDAGEERGHGTAYAPGE